MIALIEEQVFLSKFGSIPFADSNAMSAKERRLVREELLYIQKEMSEASQPDLKGM